MKKMLLLLFVCVLTLCGQGGAILTITGFPATTVQTNQSNTFTTGTQDLSAASHTLPLKKGTVAGIPTTCTQGELYFATNATAGQQIYECDSTNHWTQQQGGGGGLTSFTSPNTSITIGGTLTDPTVDVSTAYLNGLYAQTGAASTFSAGAKQTFQPSSTTAGIRISNTTLPSSTGGMAAGDLYVTTGSVFSIYDGVNINLLPGLVGSGVTLPTAPTVNRAVCWKASYTLGFCSTQPDSSGSCTCN